MGRFLSSILLLFALSPGVFAQTTVTVGDGGTEYLNLQEAFDDINAGNLTGEIILQIIDNCTQPGTAILYPTGYLGNSDYSSITIYPTGSGFVISGDIDGPLIELNGAANVTFDGRVNQAGAADLIITNISTGTLASTLLFIESASANTVHYCKIKGSGTGASSGIVFFSTATTGTGNDGNIIDNNYITADAAGRPVNAVFSAGTSGRENSGDIISNNNIFDFLNHGLASNGISFEAYTTTCTISGNSFYESASFAPTLGVTYNIIKINDLTGTGFAITGNFIGGQSASCGGSAWTKTNAFDNTFIAIDLAVGKNTSSNVQNNTIKNIDWSNSSAAKWTGIRITDGDVNVGTLTGNTIGSTSGTGSVVVTGGTTGNIVYGMNFAGGGSIICQNNLIGSITVANNDPLNAGNFYGINSSMTGFVNIAYNTIGSTSQANSINASSPSTGANAQVVMGINNNGSGTIFMNNNVIANLTNSTTNTGITRRGLINGISSTDGSTILSRNEIYNLTIANLNTATTYQASVCGIALTGVGYSKSVSGNTVYNLSNTNASFAGSIIGLFHTGTTLSANTISENFFHSFTVASSSASVYGIKINSGTSTYSNNIITLGAATATTMYGIYETGSAGNNNNLYFNTVYIYGTPTTGNKNSYALYSAVVANSRNFRNNILFNERSNSGATGSHYAMYIVTTGGTIVCDYNDYYVSGTGGILGHYGTTKNSLPIVTGQDGFSYAIDPVLTTAGSTSALDYTIGEDLIGVSGTGITTDFASAVRNNPTMGAWERIVNKWKGNTSNVWNLATNWTANAIPLENSNIVFDNTPVNDLYMDAAHSVSNITNGSDKLLVTNGKQLTIKGNLLFTNGAQLDATSASSALIFSGAAAQTIVGSNFVSAKTTNLTIDNTPGVTINGDFTVDNTLTINSGKLLTVSAGSLLTVSGTLTNNAGNSGFIIKSDGNGSDGKLINNSASVPATIELFLSGGLASPGVGIFHYFVPPVGTINIGTTIAQVKTNLGLTNFNGDLLSYSEVAAGGNKDNGWQYFDGYNSTTPFSSLVSSAGYNVYLTSDDKITFTGLLNGPTHTFSNLSFTNLGWNLVGNPYPCNYDVSGITELTTNGDDVDNTIIFNHNGGYAYWNVETGAGTTGYSDIMPPMQGFFVHVTASGKSLNLPVSYKTATAALPLRSKGADYYSSKSSEIKKIKLVLNNGPIPDETIVCLVDKATTGYDGDYDALKFFGSNPVPSIYTELNSVKYAINSVREPEESSVTVIPVRLIIKTAGTYKIDITEFENFGDLPVILRHGAIETKLNKDASYTFTTVSGTFTDFELIIGSTSVVTETEKIASEKYKVWYSKEYLYINCPEETSTNKGRIAIYDIQGKTVFSDNISYITPGQTIQIPLQLPNGIYITHIIINSKPFVSKIVVY